MEVRAVSEIIRLSKSDALYSDFDAFLEIALESLTEEIDVQYASFWFHDKEGENYSCIRCYEREQQHSKPETLKIRGENYYELFPILQTSEIIHKTDASKNGWSVPQLGLLVNDEINSWIAFPLRNAKEQFGFLMVASKNRRVYDVEDQNILCSIGLMIKESYRENFGQGLKNASTKLPNEANEKIDDFIFYTAHNLRHPITNLLSLVELIKDLKNEDGMEEVLSLIKVEALKLDDVIRVMIAKIEQDEHKV
jgi:hypothetical protein